MGDSKRTVINLRLLAENVGLEVDEYAPLLNLFVEASKGYLRELRSAIGAGDARKVYETTHTMKGAADNLGFSEMAAVARIIEIKARQNNLEGAEEAVNYLAGEIDNLNSVYQNMG